MLKAAVLASAWRPSVRTVRFSLVCVVLLACASPSAVLLVEGERSVGLALTVAALGAGSVVALAADDGARSVTDATPTAVAHRLALRVSGVLLAVVVVGSAVAAALRSRDPTALQEWPARLAELAATAGLGMGVATQAVRRDHANGAEIGAITGALAVLVVSVLASRLAWLPAIGVEADAHRWWQVAAAGWGVAAWQSRDPYRA